MLVALAAVPHVASAQNCANTSTGLVPLVDLGAGTYQGHAGGLYPGSTNVRPEQHTVDGLAQATRVVPREANGAPDPAGRIVVMSIGMSNCWQEFGVLMTQVEADATRNPAVLFVNGAQTGAAASTIAMPGSTYWTNCDNRLALAGATPQQVQVVWLKSVNLHPTNGFPGQALELRDQYRAILQNVKARYPNARIAWLASRIYAGYATSTLNPEPYAYEHGFVVKWTIEAQIQGDPALAFDDAVGPALAPWIDWGTYLWADGTTPRGDGLTWLCQHYQNDGTHPSNQGRQRVAQQVLAHLRTDPIAASWYLRAPPPVRYGTAKATSIGTTPTLVAVGTPSVAARDFGVRVEGGIPRGVGWIEWSDRPAREPFAGAFRYVAAPAVRLVARRLDATGAATWPIRVDATMVGTTRFHQAFLRDAEQPDGTEGCISDALRVVFAP